MFGKYLYFSLSENQPDSAKVQNMAKILGQQSLQTIQHLTENNKKWYNNRKIKLTEFHRMLQ